jgi:hypothetical protein
MEKNRRQFSPQQKVDFARTLRRARAGFGSVREEANAAVSNYGYVPQMAEQTRELAREADGADARLGGPRLVRCSQIEKR